MELWDDVVDWVSENPGKTATFFVTTAAAVALAPLTGGASIVSVVATRIGAAVTAETIIAVATATTVATVATNAANQKEAAKSYQKGKEAGTRAGEYAAKQQYEEKWSKKFASYQDFEKNIIAMYAIGLALANEDRLFWNEHLENLEIITGLSSNKLSQHVKKAIGSLKQEPLAWNDALIAAKKAKLPKSDVDDIVDIIASVRGYANPKIYLGIIF